MNVDQIDIKPVFFEQARFASDVDKTQRSHRRRIADDELFQFLRVNQAEVAYHHAQPAKNKSMKKLEFHCPVFLRSSLSARKMVKS